MSNVSTKKDDRKNLIKALKSIICITSSQINANINKMIMDLEMPVIGVHLTETYVAKTIDENKGQMELDIYKAVFNNRENDMFRIFNSLDVVKINTQNNALICVLNQNKCNAEITHTALFSNDGNTGYAEIKSSIKNHGKYCIYAIRIYDESNTMYRIIDALNNYIHQEYKPSSELFHGTLPDQLRKVTNMDNNFLNQFRIALTNTVTNPNPEPKLLFVTHNVFGSKGIDPTYFTSKKGTCHLKLFYRADDKKIYQPFPIDFYFPRLTLDNTDKPQVHKLCFAIVKYPNFKSHDPKFKYQWKIVALRNRERDLTANHVITNAYALVYIGQDYVISNVESFKNYVGNVFQNLNNFIDLKNKLNAQLLNYYDDTRLENLAKLIKDWKSTGKPYTSILRYKFLSSEHEKKENSKRILPYFPDI